MTALAELKGIATVMKAARQYYKTHGGVTKKLARLVLEEFEQRIAAKSVQYRRDVRLRLGKFTDFIPRDIHTITVKEIESWLDDLKAVSRTRNNFRNLIITLFKYDQKQGYLPPCVTEAEKVEELDTTDDEGDIEIVSNLRQSRRLDFVNRSKRLFFVLGAA